MISKAHFCDVCRRFICDENYENFPHGPVICSICETEICDNCTCFVEVGIFPHTIFMHDSKRNMIRSINPSHAEGENIISKTPICFKCMQSLKQQFSDEARNKMNNDAIETLKKQIMINKMTEDSGKKEWGVASGRLWCEGNPIL